MNGWNSLMRIYMRTNYSQTLIKRPPSGKCVLRCSYILFFCFQPIKSLDLALLVFSRAWCGSGWLGCFPLCQTNWLNDNFRSNLANLKEWFLPSFIPFPNPPLRELYRGEEGQWAVLSKRNGKYLSHRSDLSKWTTSRGGTEYLVRRNRNGPFHSTSNRNYRNFLRKFPHLARGCSVRFPLWLVHCIADVCCDWLLTLALCRFQLL